MWANCDLPRIRTRLASALAAVAVGLAAAAAATVARALLGLIAPDMVPYAVLFPAVLFATLAAGAGAGLVAGAAGLAAAEYFFVGVPYTFKVVNLTHGVSVAAAAASLLLMLWLAGRYRQMILARGREREALIRMQFQLFERSHGFMFVLAGPELRYEFANPTYLRLIGEKDVVGRRLLDVLPDIEPEYLDMIAQVRRTGEAFVGRGMQRTLLREGVRQTLYIDFVAQPLLAEDGSVEAVFIEGYDVTEKEETEQRLKLVVQEVDHRANNLLAVLQSIATLTKGEDAEDLRRNILGRIHALARAHQLLSKARWGGADLQHLIEEELLPYALGNRERVRIHGPAMDLSPAEAQALAIGLHELATNAAKYGALSAPGGRIEVSWDRDPDGARHIRWQEEGGPKVTPPVRKGFGTRVLERTLQAARGRTQLSWRPEGLVCEFDLPPESPEAGSPRLPLAEPEASKAE
jgi:two-component sensor histidine kinase